MAVFNPQENPTNDPSYLSLSKPIEKPNVAGPTEYKGKSFVAPSKPVEDDSMASLFKGITSVSDAVIKGGDFLIKDSIENQIHSQVDQERGGFTNALEKLNNGEIGDITKDRANASGNPSLKIMSYEETPDLPDDVENAGDEATRLKNAKDGGKISRTYYLQRLNTFASSLRSQYPGYRDYIDQKLASATGENIANAYVTSLRQDFATANSGKNTDQQKAISLIQQHIQDLGPDGPTAIKKIISGEWGYSNAFELVSKSLSQKYENNKLAEKLDNIEKNNKIDKDGVQKALTANVGNRIAADFDKVDTILGNQSLNDMKRKVDASMAGGPQVTAEDALNVGLAWNMRRNNQYQQIWKEWNTSPGPGQPTHVQRGYGTPSEGKKELDAMFAPWDEMIKYITDNKLGAASVVRNTIQAVAEDKGHELLQDGDTAYISRLQLGLRQIGGDRYWENGLNRAILTATDKEGNTLDKKMQTYLHKKMGEMQLQPPVDIRQGGSGSAGPVTLKDAIRDAQKRGKDAGLNMAPVVKGFLDQGKTLADKTVPDTVKYNIATAMYDPANFGILSSFKKDDVDPVSGRPVNSRYVTWNMLTNKDALKEVKRLSDAGDPNLWKGAVDTLQRSFGIELFNSEIRDLQNIVDHPDIKVTWDTDTKQFDITAGKGINTRASQRPNPDAPFQSLDPTKTMDYNSLATAQKVKDRLNIGLRGLKNVAEVGGFEPETFMISSLMDTLGMDGPQLLKIGGIPGKIVQAITTAKIKTQGKKTSE